MVPSPRFLLLTSWLVLTGCGQSCGAHSGANDGPDSDPDAIPPQDTAPPVAAERGVATRLAILVLDGARVEETFGDQTDYGEGWSDAWDGPSDEILPTMRERVLPTGTLFSSGYVSGITVTTPAHADLLTGRREPFLHLSHRQGIGPYLLHYPTLQETLRSSYDDGPDGAWLIANTGHLETLVHGHYPDLGIDLGANMTLLYEDDAGQRGFESDDGVVVQEAQDRLAEGARMVLANLHEIDRAGHNRPTSYAEVVSRADQPITDFHDWLSHDSDIGDETLLLVLADHGRHRFSEAVPEPWTHHGCHCSGCREVPMFLWGPGIRRGATINSPVVLEDLTSTAAWLLGITMPYSTGLVLTDAMEGEPEVEQRRGSVNLSASGSLWATQEWSSDRAHRSSVLAGDEPLGDADALHVEEPVMLATDTGDFACWRELSVTRDPEFWPWLLRCAQRAPEGTWQDLAFPEDHQWPHISPALASPAAGVLVISYLQSIESTAEGATNADDMRLRLARWTDGEGWEQSEPLELGPHFPTDTDLVASEDALWVTFSAGLSASSSRYTRRPWVYMLDWLEDDEPSWREVYQAGRRDNEGHSYERGAHPTLTGSSSGLRLAWHAYDDQGIHLLVTRANRPDRESSWSTPMAVDTSGRLYGHVPPVWDPSGQLYWAREGEAGTAEICVLASLDASPDCQDTEHPWIDSLAATDTGALASVSHGDGAWQLIDLTWHQSPLSPAR